MKKIAIDLTSFNRVHGGGKDEVSYNLLRGFSHMRVVDQIICVCREELVDIIHAIDKNYQILVMPEFQVVQTPLLLLERGKFLKKHIKELNIGCILFTNKITPMMHFPVPTYMISHDFQPLSHPSRIFNSKIHALTHKVYIYADSIFRSKIIAISEYDAKECQKYMPWSKKKTLPVYNPIRFSEEFEGAPEKKYILALNLQHPHKNVETLIRAYARIADQIPYRLMLVGKTNSHQFNVLSTLAEELGIKDRTDFPGFISQEELDEIVKSTRLYVNSSLYEGFGMTAIEMMGQKIPTIVANNTAMPEVTMGLCRYYEPTTDDAKLAEVMLEELNNPMPAEQLKDIAIKVREKYSHINVAENYWNMLTAGLTEEKNK